MNGPAEVLQLATVAGAAAGLAVYAVTRYLGRREQRPPFQPVIPPVPSGVVCSAKGGEFLVVRLDGGMTVPRCLPCDWMGGPGTVLECLDRLIMHELAKHYDPDRPGDPLPTREELAGFVRQLGVGSD